MADKRKSGSSLAVAGGLSLPAAKPMTANNLQQSYTPITDDEAQLNGNQNNAKIIPINMKEFSEDPPMLMEDTSVTSSSKKKESDHIKVICRFRPKNSKERAEEKRQNLSTTQEISVYNENKSLEVPRKSKNKPKMNFTLDSVIWYDRSQEQTFESLAKPTVESVIEGYNCTIFAFGQTGSGIIVYNKHNCNLWLIYIFRKNVYYVWSR